VLTVLIITITIQRGKDFNEYQERKPPKALIIKPNISSLLNIRFFIVNEIILSKPFFIYRLDTENSIPEMNGMINKMLIPTTFL